MPYLLLDPATAAAAPVSTAGAALTSVGETLATLQADLVEELGNQSQHAPVTLTRWINKAYKYLTSIITVKQMFSEITINLVANQPLYLLPRNVAFIKSLTVVDPGTYHWPDGGIKLTPIEVDMYRKLPDDVLNYPSAFFRHGDRLLGIYPTPRESYTARLEFRVRPADLVNATDSPIIPPEYHEALLLRAKHVAFRALKNHAEAGVARNDFVSDVRALEDLDASEKSEMPMGVRPVRLLSDINRL